MPESDLFVVTYRSEAYLPSLVEDLASMSELGRTPIFFNNTGNKFTLTAVWNDLWRSGKSEFVIFLNPDIKLSPGWDARLVGCLRSRPEVAVAMGNRYIPTDGGPSRNWMTTLARDLGQNPSFKDLGEHLEGFYAFAVRRSCLEKLKGFDERFRFYFQDSDFQLRCLRKLRMKTVQVNHCPIWHIGMVSTLEAVRRGELDRDKELRHVDLVRGKISSGELKEWDELTEEERQAVRKDPSYNSLSGKV